MQIAPAHMLSARDSGRKNGMQLRREEMIVFGFSLGY
jgi:hypothetical protein